jgi:hypothetical protein
MYRITLQDEDGDTVLGTATTEYDVCALAWQKLKCDHGPLSGRAPRTFGALADRVSNAYGGEAGVVLEQV